MTATNKRCITEFDTQVECITEWAIRMMHLSILTNKEIRELKDSIKRQTSVIWSYKTDIALSDKLTTDEKELDYYIDRVSKLFFATHKHAIRILVFEDTTKQTEAINGIYDTFMLKVGVDVKYKHLLMERPILHAARYIQII